MVTKIYWELKEEAGVTAMEYVILDLVFQLEDQGWCNLPKAKLAKMTGLTNRGIFNILNKLSEKGYLEKPVEKSHKDSRIRATEKWMNLIQNKTEPEDELKQVAKAENSQSEQGTKKPIGSKSNQFLFAINKHLQTLKLPVVNYRAMSTAHWSAVRKIMQEAEYIDYIPSLIDVTIKLTNMRKAEDCLFDIANNAKQGMQIIKENEELVDYFMGGKNE